MIFSMEELLVFMSVQKKIFNIVRLVDVSMVTQYLLSDDGRIEEQPYKCYSVCVNAGIKMTETPVEI